MTATEAYESTPIGSLKWLVCRGASEQAYEAFAIQVRELERLESEELVRIVDRARESMTAQRYICRVQFKRIK